MKIFHDQSLRKYGKGPRSNSQALDQQSASLLIALLVPDSFVVFVFNVPPTAKVTWRRGHSLKSHLTDW